MLSAAQSPPGAPPVLLLTVPPSPPGAPLKRASPPSPPSPDSAPLPPLPPLPAKDRPPSASPPRPPPPPPPAVISATAGPIATTTAPMANINIPRRFLIAFLLHRIDETKHCPSPRNLEASNEVPKFGCAEAAPT